MNSELQDVARHFQKAGCAPLLALPAALSLNAPALAQSVIGTSQTIGLTLDGLAGPVEIAPGVSINAGGAAAVSAGLPGQLINNGQILDADGIGVTLGQGGGVTNTGQIHAQSYGVRVAGAAGTVTNSGQIGAGDDGISLNRGGSVNNTGTIFGAHMGVYTGNGLGAVWNSGTISAQFGDAVSLYSGGTLTNLASGELLGGYSGVYAGGSGSSITNAGLISGPLFGAYLMGDSTITNSGTIAGGEDGVIDIGQGGTVENDGVIHGGQVGVKFVKGGRLENAGTISGGMTGVQLGKGGSLVNESGGIITGGTAGVAAGAGASIVNDGKITGLTGILVNGPASIENAGTIIAGAGGNAISLTGGASSITLETGTEIAGMIAGNGTASSIDLSGHGSFSGGITGFQAGRLTVRQNAVWTVSGNWAVGQVVNAGTLTAGLAGTPLTITGDYTQTATGTLKVVVTPQGMSHMIVFGAAHLAGALAYELSPGTYRPASYSFLTAANGVSGDFNAVTLSDAPQLGRSSSDAVDPPADPVAVSTAPAAADAASPSEVLSITRSVVVAPPDDALFSDTGQAMALAGEASGQALLARAAGGAQPSCASPVPQGSGQASGVAAALASGLCRMGGWLQAAGSDFSADGAYDARGGGFLAGLDHEAGPGRLGVAVGYDAFNLKDEAGGKAYLEAVRLGLYGSLPAGPAVLSAELMDGLVNASTTRATGAGGATASGHGNVFSAAVQAELPVFAWGSDIRPAAGLEIIRLAVGALSETAATQALAVRVGAANGVYAAPYLRLSASRRFLTARGLEITPSASLGLAVNAANPGANMTVTAQDGTAFATDPPHLSPVSGQAGLGVEAGRGNWRLSARYAAALSGNWHAQSLQAGLLVRF